MGERIWRPAQEDLTLDLDNFKLEKPNQYKIIMPGQQLDYLDNEELPCGWVSMQFYQSTTPGDLCQTTLYSAHCVENLGIRNFIFYTLGFVLPLREFSGVRTHLPNQSALVDKITENIVILSPGLGKSVVMLGQTVTTIANATKGIFGSGTSYKFIVDPNNLREIFKG